MNRSLTLLVLGLVLTAGAASAANEIAGPYSGRADRAGVSAPVRELMEGGVPFTPTRVEGLEINKLNTVVERPLDPNAPQQYDGALQTDVDRAPEVTPAPTTTCEGIANADQRRW